MHDVEKVFDGDLLVLKDKTALPMRCVHTDKPVTDRDYRNLDLGYIPSWLKVLSLLMPFFLIATPYAVRSRCRLKAGISRSVQRRFLIRKLLASLCILGSLLLPFALLYFNLPEIAIPFFLLFPFLFWGGFACLIWFCSPLKVARCENDHFWIKGCSPEYLESLRQNLAQTQQ